MKSAAEKKLRSADSRAPHFSASVSDDPPYPHSPDRRFFFTLTLPNHLSIIGSRLRVLALTLLFTWWCGRHADL